MNFSFKEKKKTFMKVKKQRKLKINTKFKSR